MIKFDTSVEKLKTVGVNVIVVEDSKELGAPDSIFSNNWISCHQNCTVVLYPMYSMNCRFEHRENILNIVEENIFKMENVDYTSTEEEDVFWKEQVVFC